MYEENGVYQRVIKLDNMYTFTDIALILYTVHTMQAYQLTVQTDFVPSSASESLV